MTKSKLIIQVLRKYSLASGYDLTKSKYLPLIFEKLTTMNDLTILSALPNIPRGVAEVVKVDESTAAAALSDLHMRGFIWVEEVTDEGPKYTFGDIGLFMDSILFDPRYDQYGDGLRDLWKRYWNEEHVLMYQKDALFRVLPVEGVSLSFEKVLDSIQIVPYEFVSGILKSARRIAVQRCACRVRERRCSNPLETCISLNNLADYTISRGIAREINYEEAMKIIIRCEELGLVHQTVNSNTPDVICNCCPCCCSFLRSILHYGKTLASMKSRFAPVFNEQLCAICDHKECVSRCIFGALSIRDGVMNVNYDKCWGCGLCARACSYGAVEMRIIRDLDHIPTDGAKFFPFVSPYDPPSRKTFEELR